MEDIHYLFRVLAVSQVLFLCCYLVIHERNRAGLLAGVTAFSFACYLVLPFTPDLWPLRFWLIVLGMSIPALVWLLSWLSFNDDSDVPVWFWICWFLYMLLWFLQEQMRLQIAIASLQGLVFNLLPQVIKLALVLHVVYMALEGRSNDVIDQRLKLRVPVATGAGLLAAVVILVEIWSGEPTPLVIEAMGSVVMFVIAIGANIYLFNLRPELLVSSPGRSRSQAAKGQANYHQAEIKRIQEAMNEQRFYANHGATIDEFADYLSLPPYRLRAIINQQMHFRNFNQFLNYYRIKEAAERLLAEPELPIITIALDIGFKSLSSFNKAFRNLHGKTPSEFRHSRN